MRFCQAPSCNNPVFSTCKISKKGYCRNHQYLKESFDKRSIVQKAIDKHKEKQKKAVCFDAEKVDLNHEYEIDFGQETWFQLRHKEMKGTCVNCGGKTQKGEKNYKCSVAHILPKAYFPSVATHQSNFIELCFYGESCHTNFDNKIIDLIDMNCFDEIIEKVTKMYPSIAQEERRRIPKILLEYIKTEQ